MVAMVVVGSGSTDPQKFTKDYCGLFTDSGVMPKRHLGRFPVTSNAVSAIISNLNLRLKSLINFNGLC